MQGAGRGTAPDAVSPLPRPRIRGKAFLTGFVTVCMVDTVYPCPLCGRSVNRKGTPFTDPSQTMSHINGAHDARHSEESGDDYVEEIQENAEELDEVVSELAEDNEAGVSSEEPTVEIEALGGDVRMSEAVADTFDLASSAFESGVSEDRVSALEEDVEKQREMIVDLVEMVELLAIAADENDVAEASEIWADHGADAAPFTWDGPAYELKQSKYE